MPTQSQSPSIVVCGSQIGVPDAAYLSQLRSGLVHYPGLRRLKQELEQIPDFWPLFVSAESSFERVPAEPMLHSLAEWITSGDSTALQIPRRGSRNMQLAVLTVVGHIVEYMAYLNRSHEAGTDAHRDVLEAVGDGGIQGLCIGLLSATALSCSHSEAEIAEQAVIAVRLALCVGACIDLDEIQASEPTDCITARWATDRDDGGEEVFKGVLDRHHQAYIAVRMDVASATIAAPRSVALSLIRELEEKKMVARPIDLHGRFHHPDHHSAYRRLVDLCAALPMLRFPDNRHPLVPLRRNDGGQEVPAEMPLHEMILRCILVEKADWHATMSTSLAALPQSADGSRDNKSHLLLLGPVDCSPRSLLAMLSLQTIRSSSTNNTTSKNGRTYTFPDHAIAIVGASCRFPHSESLPQFWDTIRAKRSTFGAPPAGRGYPTTNGPGPKSTGGQDVFAGNFLETAGSFDHVFFRKSPREALYTDPHQRIALQLAYEALESSGYFNPSSSVETNVGCYVGVSNSDYEDNVNSRPPTAFSFTGTARAFTSGRISHFFGWTGPSMAIDTACSSSGVAIHTACKAIQAGECAMALAGGVNLITSPKSYQNLGAASFLSSTGQCRPFDASADGYCRGEGGGFVLLKRLSSAVADNDHILGVIASSATNNSKGNQSITVPSSQSQSDLFQHVLRSANMDASRVSYIEAHGTGTQKGDPIECQSVRGVFGRRPGAGPPIRLGSVKGNIGHSEAASGVAALLKVLLMLQHRQIPPQASFSVLNPSIPSLEADNIEIPLRLQPWEDSFRSACVNNYGSSGSNVSMIVCQPPPAQPNPEPATRGAYRYPFLVAAHSASSLRQYCYKLLDFVASENTAEGDTLLPSVAFHLARRQNHNLAHRKMFSAASIAELKERLDSQDERVLQIKGGSKPVVLLFAGQTGHRPRLSEEAYHNSLLLQHHLHRCDRTLQSMGLRSLFPQIFGTEPINDLVDLHCMTFCIQYASAASWIDSGLEVKRVVGHSLGQLTALCVAGVLTLHDALKVISGRASLIQRRWGSERGCMLSVDAEATTVEAISQSMDGNNRVEVACYNSPSSQVVVGTEAAIITFENIARSRRISTRRLPITHGFHSQLLDCIMDEYHKLLQEVSFQPATIALEPCAKSGNSWAKVTPELVARQSRQPVYFGEAITRVAEQLGPCVWLEAGAGSTAVTLARRALPRTSCSSHSLYSVRLHGPESVQSLADVTLGLWNEGVRVQFWPFHASQKSAFRMLELPSYQFDRHQNWLAYTSSDEKGDEKQQQSIQPPLELVSFVGYVSGEPQTAEFSINQHSGDYQSLVQGRTVLGHILTPPSVWIESAARALRLLSASALPSPACSQVEQMKLHAPFGLDLQRRLRLTLRKQTATSWEFAVVSHPLSGGDDGRLQASGTIGLEEQSQSRFGPLRPVLQRLVNYDQYLGLRQDPEASTVNGGFMKKIFDHVASYNDAYFGIRSVTVKGVDAVADVCVPTIASQLCAGTISSPPVFDNFILAAEIHASNLGDCDRDHVFICNGLDAVIPQSESRLDGPYAVYSKLDRVSEEKVLSDIFVFDARRKALSLVILGARFSKMPILPVQKMLDAMSDTKSFGTEARAGSRETSSRFSRTEEIKDTQLASPSIQARELPPSLDMSGLLDVQSTAKRLLHEMTGVPEDHFNDSTGLGDFGVDSLLAIEVQARVKDVFRVDLPIRQYCEQDMTFGKMCQEIHSRLDRPFEVASSPPHLGTSSTDDSLEFSLRHPPTPLSIDIQEEEKIIAGLSSMLTEHFNCPAGIPLETPLGELGLDSLVAIQLNSDLQAMFGRLSNVVVDENSTLSALCSAILTERQADFLGSGLRGTAGVKQNLAGSRNQNQTSTHIGPDRSNPPIPQGSDFIVQVMRSLDHVKLRYGLLSQETGFAGFYPDLHQKQLKLVLAYIVEAFSTMGCDLANLYTDEPVPTIPHLPKYQKLVSLYYKLLEDGGLILRASSQPGFTRTDKPLDHAKPSELHREILAEFPQYRLEHQLLQITASRLADCLSGQAEALQLLFYDQASRKLLEDVYRMSPMFATGTRMLGEFLNQYLLNRSPTSASRRLRILEIGAGTGGTTHFMLEQLFVAGVDFDYTFTDISVALVANSKKSFGARYGGAIQGRMEFAVLDVERPPPADMRESYDIIISSNCIHATKDLRQSCTNIQQLLRDDGMLCLLELTRPLPWLDCVFGLLDGWWRFEDDREYALADEQLWRRILLEAGFQYVDWTDDESQESDQFRLILGLKAELLKREEGTGLEATSWPGAV